MQKISDYIVATNIIKCICSSKKVPFVDLPVCFDVSSEGLYNGKINIKTPEKLGNTIYLIVSIYLEHFSEICGTSAFSNDKEKGTVLILISNFIRQLMYCPRKIVVEEDKAPVVQRLYQYPFIWILMKDLISPVFKVPLKNHQVVACSSPNLDVSCLIKGEPGEKFSSTIETPFIFVNTDIEYKPLQMASMLISCVKCCDLNPFDVFKDIVDSELRNKLIGLAKLEFPDDKQLNDFFAFLLTYVGIENKMEYALNNSVKVASIDGKMIKTAQFGMGEDGMSSSWWYLGLMEKMLGSVRGADWTTYKRLHPFFEELWNKIEVERKKRGRNGLSYEALLRIKDGEIDPKNVRVIEKMLASDRVW